MGNISQHKIDQLTGLRFFAGLLVFLSHLKWDNFDAILQDIFDQGYVGVSFFFVLSGFVLSLSYKERLRDGGLTRLSYIFLRLARLTPLHFLTATPFVILAAFKGMLAPWIVICNLFYLQSWVPSSIYYFSLNAPSWSLSNEMFFYLSFPLLVLLSERDRRRLAGFLVGCVFVIGCLVEYFYAGSILFGAKTFSHWLFYIFPGFRLVEFIIGMIIFDLYKNNSLRSCRLNSFALPILFLAMYFGKQIPESFRMSLYYLPFVTFLLASHLDGHNKYLNWFFSMPLLVLLGEASFAFYLIHQPIILLARYMFPEFSEHSGLFFLVLLVFISICSVFIYFIYERPVESFLKKLVWRSTD